MHSFLIALFLLVVLSLFSARLQAALRAFLERRPAAVFAGGYLSVRAYLR